MILFAPVFALVIGVTSIVFFEAVYGALKTHARARFSKGTSCAVWWIVMMLSVLPNGIIAYVLYLPAFAVIGCSHYHLARDTARTITVQEVADYLPVAVTRGLGWLRSFIRKGGIP